MARARLDGFQRLALLTTAATYLLILVGALVRASGAGLGCPDWPRCFGGWFPPTSAKDLPPEFDPSLFNAFHTWTEYLNRLLGVLVGLLIFGTLVMALRLHRSAPRILWPTVAAFVLVAFEGWLGGKVVALELKSWIVTAHLVVALVIVSLLLYAAVGAFFPGGRPQRDLPAERRVLGMVSNGVIGLVLGQIALGALVRGAVEAVKDEHPGLPRASWLEHVGALDLAHRQLAVLCFVLCGLLLFRVWKKHRAEGWLVFAAATVVGLCGVQILSGLGLAYAGMPAALQVVHLSLASLLLGALTAVSLLAYRLGPPSP